jgi:hypothetical protein
MTKPRLVAQSLALLVLGLFLFYPVRAEENVVLDLTQKSGLLLSGWSEREHDAAGTDFTFASAQTVLLRAPVRGQRDRVIEFHGWPASYPDAPEQKVTVRVNGTPVGSVPLANEALLYGVFAPARLWHDRDNVIALEFAYTMVPKEKVPGAGDERTLAFAFHFLKITSVPKE